METSEASTIRWRAGCATLLAICGSPSALAEISGHVALTSEYIYRGMSWSNGNPALQGGIDYAHDSGFFAGIWASTVDQTNPTGRRDVELDYYVGYNFAADAPIATSVALVHYTYPDNSSDVDYDFTEALLTASWQNYSLELGLTDDLYGFDTSSHHLELRGDWSLPSAWILGAGLGYSDGGNLSSSSYLYWDAGVSARFSRITVDLRWFDNESVDGRLGNWSAGSQAVATLSVAF